MNRFNFKQFSVQHQNSTMKVGTDAVLLGSYVGFESAKQILDVGTGCGVIALIAAQKSQAKITGIDIHVDSIVEANHNFQQSIWENRLTAIHQSFQDFAQSNPQSLDMIVSNPPFFVQSLKSPVKEKSLAKHNDYLSFEAFAISSDICLQPKGKVCVILPAQESEILIKEMVKRNFLLTQTCNIYPKPSKPYNRKIMIFEKETSHFLPKKDTLIIRNEDNTYTKEYKSLTSDLYLNL